MADVNLYAEFLVNMFAKMLGRINTSMLTSSTAETEHQTRETSLQITMNMSIRQFINTLQEGQDFAIIFKETDYRLIKSGQLLVRLISARIVRASAIEDITASIAARILWNALSIRETEHANHQRTLCIIARESGWAVLWMRGIRVEFCGLQSICSLDRLLGLWRKLGHGDKSREHFMQIRIGTSALSKQVAKAFHCWRNALEEMLLAFEIASETISAKHLKQPEQDTKLQALTELLLANLLILLQILQIDLDEFLAKPLRIARRSLPKEAGNIVLDRPTPASLEVYEVRIVLTVEHHIPCLKVAIHKGSARYADNIASHQLERGFELQLMKVETCGFQEAILEVVEVEKDIRLVKSFLRITLAEVKSKRSSNLHSRQSSNGLAKQLTFVSIITPSCLSTSLQSIEERLVSKVVLEVAQTIFALCNYLRHRKS